MMLAVCFTTCKSQRGSSKAVPASCFLCCQLCVTGIFAEDSSRETHRALHFGIFLCEG